MAEITKQSTDKIDSDNELDYLITLQETQEEIDQFKQYVLIFKMKNPRQIRRLRNSYRLLKVVEKGREGINLMFIVFLMEHLMQSKSDTIIENSSVQFDINIFDNTEFNQKINSEISSLRITNLKALALVGMQVILPSSHENNFGLQENNSKKTAKSTGKNQATSDESN